LLRSDLGTEFDRLWLAHLVSAGGSQVTYLAVPLTAALVLGASPTEMGILGAVEQLPFVVVGLWAGVWADRLPRRALLIAADVGRALLVASVPVAAALGVLSIGWLYAAGFLTGALTVVAGVAGGALLPSLVRRGQLVRANARFAAADAAVGVVGPGLGGALVQALTGPVALLADAASYVVSAALLTTVGAGAPPAAGAEPRRNALAEALEGLRAVAADRLLRPLATLLALRMFFGAAMSAPYLLFATGELGVDPTAIGLVFSVGSAGLVLGAVVPGRLAGRIGVGPTLALGLLAFGVAGALVAGAPAAAWATVPVLVAGQVFVGLGAQLFHVSEASIRQASAPEDLRGRVGGATGLAVGLGTTTGLLAGGLAGELLGLRPALALVAAGQLVLGLLALRSPVGRSGITAEGEGR
jgi:MFS family permease